MILSFSTRPSGPGRARRRCCLWAAGLVLNAVVCGAAVGPEGEPTVEVEEGVYTYQPANNGAGPMWCAGSTSLVRLGDRVVAAGLETLADVKPLNNCRWQLYEREDSGWVLRHADPTGRTREPSPLAIFSDGRLFLSANPTLVPAESSGPARPEILEWTAARVGDGWRTRLPEWGGKPVFTEHSYRSLAADGARGELVLFQNVGYTHAEWAFLDRTGAWSAHGQLKWPWGAEYEKPQPIRVCYPNVALNDRRVFFVGVSDIVEPKAPWRAFKKELTGQEWDYDFRRLFLTWSDDIRTGRFHEWIELASREATCGGISLGDLWIAPDGMVHMVWTERAIDERLRARFFPEAKQRHALEYVQWREGREVLRRTLACAEEGGSREIPSSARFHADALGRLFVVYYCGGADAAGKAVSENRLMVLRADGTPGRPVRLPLRQPFTSYFTATPRGGSAPSVFLDLLGSRAGVPNGIGYARIRIP